MNKETSLNLNTEVSCEIGPTSNQKRSQQAFLIREEAALFEKDIPLPGHPCNGDSNRYPNKIADYTKALPHNKLGEVDLNAYGVLIRALSTGEPEVFESIPLGGVTKLVDPQAAYAFEMAGPDSHHLSIIPPPTLSSAEEASEMAEEYWMALARDVPFIDYDTNPITIAASADLSKFTEFSGPKVNSKVTTGTLFRGNLPGDLVGPYVSQFLQQDIPFGPKTIVQRNRTTVPDVDYLTKYQEWLDIQNGSAPTAENIYELKRRYIYDGRSIGEYVHQDFTFQAALTACLILLSYGQEALSPTNPYLHSTTQTGSATFGDAHALDFVVRAARPALEGAWFQKWLVHRRLRPEEYGGLVQNLLTGAANYSINPELLNSQVIAKIYKKYGTYLLPQAYPEGCPNHPAYPAGHSASIGACVTMLKAFFKESFVIPNPVMASADGLSLLPYTGPALTVGGELNKLAANLSLARSFAGVHWRSDNQGVYLGENIAIGILEDYRNTYNENFSGFTFTKFDGNIVTI
ncbi:vanadium-dependent haloperoxidase [Desulfosporosinus sp. SB140]|uniref:vanadium-dependent haloperoxidase n=1 Tax=Desulfosporosinus paludis TaxID=3115649 RepID=UPI00388FF6DE